MFDKEAEEYADKNSGTRSSPIHEAYARGLEEGLQMKRFLFYCSHCGFEYSGPNAEPCSCSFCGAINECYCVEEI